MIELKQITKYYYTGLLKREKVTGVSNLSLKIEKGEFFGFLGPNGAGKTTILKLIIGFLFPDKGTILINGKHISSEIKQRIAFLPENPFLYKNMTADEILFYFSNLFPKRRINMEGIRKLLVKVNLKNWQNKRIGNFSKGMLQRLAIAQCLVNAPELLILDEPLSGLDPLGRKLIKDLLISLNKEGKTIIFSTHILSDVEEMCNRVGILSKGHLIKIEPLNKLLSDSMGSYLITFSGVNSDDIPDYRGRIENQGRTCVLRLTDGKQVQKAEEIIITKGGVIERLEREVLTLEQYFTDLIRKNDEKEAN